MQIDQCCISGAVHVNNVGACVQISDTIVENARGLPGIMVEGGSEVVVYHRVVVRGCKLGLSVSNVGGGGRGGNGRGSGGRGSGGSGGSGDGVNPFATSTLHVLTNQLETEGRNGGPDLEDDGGMIVRYVSVLQELLWEGRRTKRTERRPTTTEEEKAEEEEKEKAPLPTMKVIRSVMREMCTARGVCPSGRGELFCRNEFVKNISALKERMPRKGMWTLEINQEWGAVLARVDMLLSME